MDDNGIVRLYWDQNELAIRETSAKYGGYIKTLPAIFLNIPCRVSLTYQNHLFFWREGACEKISVN